MMTQTMTQLWICAAAFAAGALVAVSPFMAVIAGSAACIYGLLFHASLRRPLVLAALLLFVLQILPPFYREATGETPFFVSFLLLPLLFLVILMRLPDMSFQWDAISRGLLAFLGAAALSLPFSWWLSGADVGAGSVVRWFLLAHAGLLYFVLRAAASPEASGTESNLPRLLLAGAVLSAAYGIVDFFWPIPIPHPAGDQFVWLPGAVVRRAQGVFYEASNFANFCAIFLVAVAAAFVSRRERYLGVSRFVLMLSIPVLTLALLVAFSRSAWASVLVGLMVMLGLSRRVTLQRVALAAMALALPIFLLWVLSPDLWDYLWSIRLGRMVELFNDPNLATSGRFDTWMRVIAIMRDEPQFLLFGVGYKSLPVTRLFQSEIITDNGYLSLLLETGVIGLAGFIFLSFAILKTFLDFARRRSGPVAFWSIVLVSIWCGELVQMMATDAYTYWRNITMFAALAAVVMNMAERDSVSTEIP